MSTKISSLPVAVSIDGSNDYFPIVQSSTTNKINRTTFLGITGAPVGISDSQSLTNKTLDNTNTVTLKDTLFTLQDDGDTSKQAKFQLSGITTGTTRTYTLPNATDTLAGIAATQTLTNKTITSPAITGGTIDNSTITVDSIAGHTSGTIVTVANLQISNGVLNSANAVTATSIADGAIQPKALVTGTGSGWAWQTYAPTWTNVSGGVTTFAKYIQIGKTVFVRVKYTLAGAGVTGDVIFSLPVTASADYSTGVDAASGNGTFLDAGNALYPSIPMFNSSTTISMRPINAAGTNAKTDAVASSTNPFTFGNGDIITADFSYEAA